MLNDRVSELQAEVRIAERTPRWLLLLTLALVALNLREVLTSVPTVVGSINEELGWGPVTIGALTTLPVLCMGLFALPVPRIAARIGRRMTVWVGLVVMITAISMRIASAIPGVLHVSVILGGIGLALIGGLMPSIVRDEFPDRIGMASGAWTGAMFVGATMGAALTVPMAGALGSWERALAFWAITAVVGLIAWTVVERPFRDRARPDARASSGLRSLPWRNKKAWALTAYCSVNSLVFYSAVAWIAPSYVSRGWSDTSSGLLFGVFAGAQVAGALILPPLAQRLRAPRAVISVMVVITFIGLAMVAFAPFASPVIVMFAIGFSHSGGYAVSLSLISLFAVDGSAAARITAMSFFVMYVFAAFGPVITGAILGISGSFTALFAFLAVFSLAQLAPLVPLRHGSSIS